MTKAQPWRSQINPLEKQHRLSPGTCPAKNRGRGDGVKEHELVGRRKNPAASVPEPRAAFLKEWEGEAERLLAPSVHVFCIPALVFTQSEAGVLRVRMKGRGGAFLGAMLRGAAVCVQRTILCPICQSALMRINCMCRC